MDFSADVKLEEIADTTVVMEEIMESEEKYSGGATEGAVGWDPDPGNQTNSSAAAVDNAVESEMYIVEQHVEKLVIHFPIHFVMF